MSKPAAGLTLALLVTRVGLADDHDAAVAADHLAVIADRLDARVDLHDVSLLAVIVPVTVATGRYFSAETHL